MAILFKSLVSLLPAGLGMAASKNFLYNFPYYSLCFLGLIIVGVQLLAYYGNFQHYRKEFLERPHQALATALGETPADVRGTPLETIELEILQMCRIYNPELFLPARTEDTEEHHRLRNSA